MRSTVGLIDCALGWGAIATTGIFLNKIMRHFIIIINSKGITYNKQT
jgi:uncharacterized membrane protein YtjA (UPF0391 family)